MKSLIQVSALGILILGGSATVRLSSLPAQDAQGGLAPCEVDGSQYPELIPEYFVWEFYFRTITDSAKGDLDESTGKRPSDHILPEGVRKVAERDLHIPVEDADLFLRIADAAVRKADILRSPRSSVSDREGQLESVDAILDARDDLARRLPVRSFKAIKRQLPIGGTVFRFPSRQ